MATRIAVMAAGRLQQVGTPREVYETPANLFVAQFIGTPPMNTVPGRIEGGALIVGESRFAVRAGAGHRRRPPDRRRRPARARDDRRRRRGEGRGPPRRVARPRGPRHLRRRARASRSRCASRPARCRPRWTPPSRCSWRRSTCTSSTRRPPSGSVAEREEPARAGRFTEAGHGVPVPRALGDPLRGLLLLSLRAARPPRPVPEQRPGHEPPLRRLGAVQRRPHRRRVPPGPLAQHPVRDLHGARRPDPRHAPGGRRQPQAPRHQDLPDDLLVDRRHVGRGGVGPLLRPASTRRSACSRSTG